MELKNKMNQIKAIKKMQKKNNKLKIIFDLLKIKINILIKL